MSAKAAALGILALMSAGPASGYCAQYDSPTTARGADAAKENSERKGFTLGRRLAEVLDEDGCVVSGKLLGADAKVARPVATAETANITLGEWLYTGKCVRPSVLSVSLHDADADPVKGGSVVVGLWRPGKARSVGGKPVQEAFVVANADVASHIRNLVQIYQNLLKAQGESEDLARLAQSSEPIELGFVATIISNPPGSFKRLDSHELVPLAVQLLTNPSVPDVGCFLVISQVRSLLSGSVELITSDEYHVLLDALVQLAASDDAGRAELGLRNIVFLEEQQPEFDIDPVVTSENRGALVGNYEKALRAGKIDRSNRLEAQLGLKK